MYETMLSDAEDAVGEAQDGIDLAASRMSQMAALSDASDDLQAALAALSGSTPTQAQLDAANDARTALMTAISDGTDLTEGEKATYVREAANAAAPISTAQMAFDDAQDAADDAARMAMAATAAKLYAGIYAPADDATGTATSDVHAAYNTDATAIAVTIGTGTAAGAAVTLSEDKDATVAANHGWTGKMYADPAGGDSYEARVFSNVEAPKMGKKFGGAAAGDEFEYTLVSGELTAANAHSSGVFLAARVAFTGVTRTAGTETFKLPDPNDLSQTKIRIPGSYHGVSGNYYCVPGTPADGCSADVAAKGFTLSTGDTWTFTPGNASARVMDAADTAYASYGWWLKTASADGKLTASAFHGFKGTPGTVDIANLVGGTATYMGGAAGQYALSSTTGGENDAGAFTARAMLEANFETDMVSGTIDNFMGADGMAKDWTVKLNKTDIGNDGAIDGTDASDAEVGTVWTISGTAATKSGEWSGNLREEGTDGVPKAATGIFYTEYGRAGRMVGAFGANKQ